MMALLLAGSAQAQQKIFINNGTQTNKEIPLATGSTVAFDTNGNLRVDCELTNGVCLPLASGGTPPPAGAPTIGTFARNDGDTNLEAGESIRVTWASTGAAACAGTVTAKPASATVTWAGVKNVSSSGNGESIALPVAGNYEFSLQCFNAAGGSQLKTIAVTAAAVTTPPPPAGCDLPADPLIQPTGWKRTNKTWVAAFSSYDGIPAAVYPTSVGFPVPLGAEKGGYTVIPFTPTANMSVALFWETVQANSIEGYSKPRPAHDMFISISPCAGDVRAPAPENAPDPWLQPGCRKFAGTATMFYTTLSGYANNNAVCRLEAGRTYYINVMAADPSDGLTLGEHTCQNLANGNTAVGCDVQATHRPQ